jgi:hypothetical protein
MKPAETGYYHHTNGNGLEEIVYVYFYCCRFWVKNVHGGEHHLDEDKGVFGERIPLPSENF